MTALMVLTGAERCFIYWLAYAFVGWAWETGLSVVLRRRFEDRGVLNGPLCPIYGFGGLLAVAMLGDVSNPVALFLSCGVLACTLEYLSSWAIEALFHVRLWDYTGKPFNINGRVYLNGFLAFGAGATAVVMVVQPWMAGIVESWPPLVLHLVAGLLCAATLADAAVTVAGLVSFDTRLGRVAEDLKELKLEQIRGIDDRITAADEQWERRMAEARSDLETASEEARGRIRGTLNWQQRRLIRIFPTLTSSRDAGLAERIRALLERRR
ncbi:putative ABC transporter permease [Bifidobacterium avesanii]|uniref:Transporter n=1 Tax=Bifidobacterium avesanii TaxID=1798157 RepID=A0A7K3TEH1_9BIFI|nr:putative ABC transporter permease [Bifidobacterium avesanii]KAB8295426.1 putative ABC-transporter type IV [Bifidobacterium avesanii]NEG77432.1 hypothetical protein [Bifidobacterium avesanii]